MFGIYKSVPDTCGGSTLSFSNTSENAYHVLITANLSSAAVIDGFTIQGGNADGSEIISYKANQFRRLYGGGMSHRSSSPSIANLSLINNQASHGGGMYNISSSPEIVNLIISKNLAFHGGGIKNFESSPIINNSTFLNNYGTNRGGCIFNDYSSPSITNSVFTNNFATSRGGGLYNDYYSSPVITNVAFVNSNAIRGGGMYNSIDSSPVITNATFLNNNVLNRGGGMYNVNNSSPVITNATFVNNAADVEGGGMYNDDTSFPTITNTIFWDNNKNGANNVAGADIKSVVVGIIMPVVTHCITQANSEYSIGTEIINNQDPLFVDAANGIFNLRCNSPAINKGTATGAPTDDITGFTRTGNPDMGAYEFGYANIDLPLADGTNLNLSGIPELKASSQILNTNNVLYQGANSVQLLPGFSVAPTAGAATVFRAEIGGGCPE